jgi:hypothetical protein
VTAFEEKKNMTTVQQFDQARAEAFVGRLLNDLNGGVTMSRTAAPTT